MVSIPCKVVFVGESGVGKADIARRYVTGFFNKSLLTATPVENYMTKILYLESEDPSIKFELWDSAGQGKYASLPQIFYKNASVVILVYDITKRNSFTELKKYWIKEVLEYCRRDISRFLYI